VYKLKLELPIYTFQIDFSGHVSNVVYIQWLEICRLKLLEHAGFPVHREAASGLLPVLTDTEISYRKPLYLGDTARAEAWLSELGGASAWVEYRIYNGDGDLCARARQRGLWIDAATKKPRRFTKEQRERFEAMLADETERQADT
jgi:acyl-CoA thioester hydrolase